jgi:hypothetical protein
MTTQEILKQEIIKRNATDAKFEDGRLWVKGGRPCANTGQTYAADEWHKTMYSEQFVKSAYLN